MTSNLAKISQLWKVMMVGLFFLLASFQVVEAAPPEPAVDIRTRLQPYQTSGLSGSQSSAGRLLQEAPSPAKASEPPISVLAQQTFYAAADAVILQGYPAVNFGDTIDMWAGYDDSLEPDGRIARSLIKFNLVGLPPGQTITKATLRVYLISSWDFPNTNRTVTAYRITSDWSENSVTWSNAPGYGSSYGSRSIGELAWGWHDFDVTDLIRNWYNGTAANYGVMLRGPEVSGVDSSWRGFSTREGSDPPQLVIEYQDGPELPARPNPLTATPLTQTQINLLWGDNSHNETGFKIERSPDGVSNWQQITTVGANVTTYVNGGLAPGTTYFYRVRAYNAAGNSDPSDLASATTPPNTITYNLYLPLIIKNFSPPPPPPPGSKPVDGHWTGTTSRSQPMSFDVSSGGTLLSNFKLKTDFQVGPCSGTTEITIPNSRAITNNQFSGSSGNFSFSGQFTTPTSASGTYTYANYSIIGCGFLNQSGTWTANTP